MNLRELAQTLRFVGALLDADHADYVFDGRFRFELADGWSLIVSSDSAERLRLDAYHRSGVRGSLWCIAADRDRLKALVLAAKEEAIALVA
jgi:hypothetical protein